MTADGPPSISVVIPVYEDPDGLRTTLASVTDQTVGDHEIVVVDNGSTDRTPQVARRFAQRHTSVSVAVEAEVQSSYAARNRGIDVATGEAIAFLDADTWVPADYVETVRSVVADRAYVGCEVEIRVQGDGLVERYNRANGFPVERYVTEVGYAPTCCLTVAREVIAEVGPFDDTLVSSGDVEFGGRVRKAGYEPHYTDETRVVHPARRSVRALVSKAVRIGRGKAQLAARYPESYPLDRSPGRYLPPHPGRFRSDHSEDPDSSLELACWYGLATVEKCARRYGELAERFG